jgi:hypothetical protein
LAFFRRNEVLILRELAVVLGHDGLCAVGDESAVEQHCGADARGAVLPGAQEPALADRGLEGSGLEEEGAERFCGAGKSGRMYETFAWGAEVLLSRFERCWLSFGIVRGGRGSPIDGCLKTHLQGLNAPRFFDIFSVFGRLSRELTPCRKIQ